MPKLNTHRGAAKRFRTTKKGKIKRSKAFASHLKIKKSAKKKRKFRQDVVLGKSDAKRIKKLLPG